MKAGSAKGIVLRTIFFISGNRMAQLLHVHADLVFSAGFEFNLQQGELFVALQYFVMGYGLVALSGNFGGVHDQHLVLLQKGSYGSLVIFDNSLNNSNVGTSDYGFLPLFLHDLLYFLTFCEHHHTRSVAVEPMNHENAVGRIFFFDMGAEDGIGGQQFLLGSSDGEHSCLLVDDHQIGIFK